MSCTSLKYAMAALHNGRRLRGGRKNENYRRNRSVWPIRVFSCPSRTGAAMRRLQAARHFGIGISSAGIRHLNNKVKRSASNHCRPAAFSVVARRDKSLRQAIAMGVCRIAKAGVIGITRAIYRTRVGIWQEIASRYEIVSIGVKAYRGFRRTGNMPEAIK